MTTPVHNQTFADQNVNNTLDQEAQQQSCENTEVSEQLTSYSSQGASVSITYSGKCFTSFLPNSYPATNSLLGRFFGNTLENSSFKEYHSLSDKLNSLSQQSSSKSYSSLVPRAFSSVCRLPSSSLPSALGKTAMICLNVVLATSKSNFLGFARIQTNTTLSKSTHQQRVLLQANRASFKEEKVDTKHKTLDQLMRENLSKFQKPLDKAQDKEKPDYIKDREEQQKQQQHQQHQQQTKDQNKEEESDDKITSSSKIIAPSWMSNKSSGAWYHEHSQLFSEWFSTQVSHVQVIFIFFEILKLALKDRELEYFARKEERDLQEKYILEVAENYKKQSNSLFSSGLTTGLTAIFSAFCPILGIVGGDFIKDKLSSLFSSLQKMDTDKLFEQISKITFSISEWEKGRGQIEASFSEGSRTHEQQLSDFYRVEAEDRTRSIEEIKEEWRSMEQMIHQILQMDHEAIRYQYN